MSACGSQGRHGLAVAADGSAAVRSGTLVRLDANGNQLWSVANPPGAGRCSVAIDAAGITYADVENANFESTDARKYALLDGSELARETYTTLQYQASMSSSPTGDIVTCSSGHSDAYVKGPSVNAVKATGAAGATPNWCSMAGTEVAWMFWRGNNDPPSHWQAFRYGGAGQLWALDRYQLLASPDKYGTTPRALAGSTGGRIAVVGRYRGITVDTIYVQVYDP